MAAPTASGALHSVNIDLHMSDAKRTLLTQGGIAVVEGTFVSTGVDLFSHPNPRRVGEGASLHTEVNNSLGCFLQLAVSEDDFDSVYNTTTVNPATAASIFGDAATARRVQLIDPRKQANGAAGAVLYEVIPPPALAENQIAAIGGAYIATERGYYFAVVFDNGVVATWFGSGSTVALHSVVQVISAAPSAAASAAVAAAAPSAVASVAASAAPSSTSASSAPRSISIEVAGNTAFLNDGVTPELKTLVFAPLTPAELATGSHPATASMSLAELTAAFGTPSRVTVTSTRVLGEKKKVEHMALAPNGQVVVVGSTAPKVLHTLKMTLNSPQAGEAEAAAPAAGVQLVEIGAQRRWSNLTSGNRCVLAIGGPNNALVAAVDESPAENRGVAVLHLFMADAKDNSLVGGNFVGSCKLNFGEANKAIVDSLIIVPADASAHGAATADSNQASQEAPDVAAAAAPAAEFYIVAATARKIVAVTYTMGSTDALKVSREWNLTTA